MLRSPSGQHSSNQQINNHFHIRNKSHHISTSIPEPLHTEDIHKALRRAYGFHIYHLPLFSPRPTQFTTSLRLDRPHSPFSLRSCVHKAKCDHQTLQSLKCISNRTQHLSISTPTSCTEIHQQNPQDSIRRHYLKSSSIQQADLLHLFVQTPDLSFFKFVGQHLPINPTRPPHKKKGFTRRRKRKQLFRSNLKPHTSTDPAHTKPLQRVAMHLDSYHHLLSTHIENEKA